MRHFVQSLRVLPVTLLSFNVGSGVAIGRRWRRRSLHRNQAVPTGFRFSVDSSSKVRLCSGCCTKRLGGTVAKIKHQATRERHVMRILAVRLKQKIYDSCVLYDSYDSYDWTFASQQCKPSSNYKAERKPESLVMFFLFSASPALGTCQIMSKLRRLMMPWAMRSFCTAWSRSVHFGRPGDQVISSKDFAESLQTWEKFGDSDAVSPHTLDTVHCHEATALALILISLDISLIFYLSVYLCLSHIISIQQEVWTDLNSQKDRTAHNSALEAATEILQVQRDSDEVRLKATIRKP